MTELAALIFDIDGTLADTERDAHRVAFNDTFAAHGLEWYWSAEFYGELLAVTGGRERIKHYVTQHHPPLPTINHLDAFIADLHREKTQCFLDIVRAGQVPLRPGVQRLLTSARQAGLRLAIATTTSYINVQTLLEYCIHPLAESGFDAIAAGDVVTHKKPAPDIYFYALSQLNLRADQCLAIEDSDNGLRASLSAGICTIITTNDYTSEQDFTGASLVVDQLGEPHQPFTKIVGDVGETRWVDVPLLKNIHKRYVT